MGRETRRRLVEWWSNEYCASRMNLCVIGRGMSKSTSSMFLIVDLSQQSRWMSFPIWFLGTFRPS